MATKNQLNYQKTGITWFERNKNVKKLCKCKCGNYIVIKEHHCWCGVPNYILGHHRTGNKCSDKTKKKISIRNIGKIRTGKTKEKIRNSDYHKNLKGKNNPFYNKKHKKETIEMITNTINNQWEDGRKAWNDGLTKDNDKRIAKGTQKMTKTKRKPEVRKKAREYMLNRIERLGGSNIGENEKPILDNLEKFICPYKIIRQYIVAGYSVDGYCPALNMAIEVDEPHHFNKDGSYIEADIIRQKIIEKELKCSFFRIKTEV